MTILLALIIGVLAGTASGLFFYDGIDHFIANIVCSIAGSLLGLFTYALLQGLSDDSLVNVRQILATLLGSLLFVSIYNGIHRVADRHTGKQNIPGGEVSDSQK